MIRRNRPISTSITPAAAIADPELLGPAFAGDSWATWSAVLKAAYAERLTDAELALFKGVSGDRNPPSQQVRQLWVIAGRRSGKDSIASAIATVAAFGDYNPYLRPGERAVVMCLAVNRDQARIVHRYVTAYFQSNPLLRPMVVRETDDGLELNNNVDVVVATNSYRVVRGRTIVCVILDEPAFWRDENSATPDVETFAALLPAMVTIPTSMLIGITTAYRRSGLAYERWQRYFGKDDPTVLVVAGPTTVFNPTIPQSVIDDALARDYEAAASEWLGAVWRSDLSDFLDREIVDAAVDHGSVVRPPQPGIAYSAFTDPSGGRGDSFTLAIAHAEGNLAVLDCLYERRAPFDPSVVVVEIADLLRSYGIAEVTGDRYAAGWVTEGFAKAGITYKQSQSDRSAIYLDVLPIFTAGRARLLDQSRLVHQLINLERRAVRGGRDRIDHPPGGADDLANSAAGALVLVASAAAPTLWQPAMLLSDGNAAPWPASAEAVIATVAADDGGCFWCLWARDTAFGGPPLALIDFGRAPFSRELITTLAARIVAEARVSHAPSRALYAPAALAAEIIAVVTEEAVRAISSGSASVRDFDIAVKISDDIDELLKDRDALLLTAATAIGAGRCKLTNVAVERARTLPNPLSGLRPGALQSASMDAALIALAVTFAKPPVKPIVRSNQR